MNRIGKTGATRRTFLSGSLAAGALLAARVAPAQPAALPPAPRDDTVDILHGTPVADPFRPLEDLKRADVKAWMAAQDDRARTALATPTRARVRKYLDAVHDYPRTSIPSQYGTRFFSYFNDGLSNQRSLGVQDHLAGPRRTVIDASKLSNDGTIAISGAYPDRRGLRVAYLTSEAGSDRQTLHVHDVDGGFDLRTDVLSWCKHTSVAWLPNGRGFYYTRYPGDSDPPDWDRKSHMVCVHRVGRPQADDRVVFRLPALRDVYMRVEVSIEARTLKVIAGSGSSEKRGYYVAPLDDLKLMKELLPVNVAGFWPIGNVGATHYALTNLDAPKWRLVRLDQLDPKPDRWHTVVPESEMTLDHATVFNSRLVVKHLDNLNSKVSVYDLDGRKLSTLDFGGPVRVWFGRHNRGDDHLLLEVEERNRPSRIEWLDLNTRKNTLFRPTASKDNLSDLVYRDVTVTSRDGTKVPLTLIHRPGIALDGTNRTLLYAYGGFGIPIWAGYSEIVATWVRLGGVYAIAAIRGGGEFGQAWHDGARTTKRQNAFDDFIAAAEWLIANKITRPDRLGINGASNGGLLVLSCILQRPDLYGAVVSGVPVADMLRFKRFTFGSNWTTEYGDPDVESDFKALRAYSPVHNVRAGVKYPPLLVLTADSDDRVAPVHSCKVVAAMQDAAAAETYLKIETRAGHGFGNALNKSLDRISDTIAFMCEKLGGPVLDLPGA